MKLIENEITNAKKGKEAYILLKMNNLVDKKMIDKLYEASEAGVKIRLIIRGICCLITGKENLSENIRGIGVIDRFLEHTRIYIFCNGGKDSTYISSSDWMTRNLDYRIELSCPVLDPKVKEEVRNIIETQWKDNVKARVLNEKMDNNYRKMRDEKPIRSQYVVYENLKKTLHK
jgi:polyphosphate kinase